MLHKTRIFCAEIMYCHFYTVRLRSVCSGWIHHWWHCSASRSIYHQWCISMHRNVQLPLMSAVISQQSSCWFGSTWLWCGFGPWCVCVCFAVIWAHTLCHCQVKFPFIRYTSPTRWRSHCHGVFHFQEIILWNIPVPGKLPYPCYYNRIIISAGG